MGVWSRSIHSFQQMCSQRGHSLLPLQMPLQQHSVTTYRPVKRHRTVHTSKLNDLIPVIGTWHNRRFLSTWLRFLSMLPDQGPWSWAASGARSYGGKVALTSSRISAGSWKMLGVRHRAASPGLVGFRSHRCCSDHPLLALAALLLAASTVQP